MLCCDDDVVGKCDGNTKMAAGLEPHGTRRLAAHLAGTFKFKCATGSRLKPDADTITGATDAACCNVNVGRCSGNLATATDLAEVALAGSLLGTSGTTTAAATAGTFQFACGMGFLVKPNSVVLSGADAAAKKGEFVRSCCCCSFVCCFFFLIIIVFGL